MALNGASHNIPGEKTGPATGPPPVLDFGTKQTLVGAANRDPIGQHAPAVEGVEKEKVSDEGEVTKGASNHAVPDEECHVKWKGKDVTDM